MVDENNNIYLSGPNEEPNLSTPVTYDFDAVIDRTGTYAEKYDARKRLFGNDTAEPFWVADMDLPTPKFVVDAIARRVAHPIFGYTEPDAGVFDAVRWWMRHEHGLDVERSWIRLSPSVVTSMSMAIQSMTEPGDQVVLLSPVYGPFFTSVTANERRVKDLPLILDSGRYEIDFNALEAALAQKETTLLLLCNPHNPGGRVFSRDELERIVTCCRENSVKIFSDEIHCDILFSPHRHHSLLCIPGAADIAIVAFSIGKAFNTSGLNASFVLIPDPALRKGFSQAQNRAHAGEINLIGKAALAAALSEEGVNYKRQLVSYLHRNTREVVQKLRSVPGLFVMEPEATYLVWADFRGFGSPAKVMHRLMTEAKVLLSGGGFFGPAGEGFFRVNCAHPSSRLYPAVDRIVEMLKS